MIIFISYAIIVIVLLKYKKLKPDKIVRKEAQNVKNDSCIWQLKEISLTLNGLYKQRDYWENIAKRGAKYDNGDIFDVNNTEEYVKVKSKIEQLENKQRKLLTRCS